ncbi:MAG: hypothetical protein J6M39_05575 [Lachnospiraceae bacterium]|nr:hypothetical protein [Lachnospiraceae bacterium]
MKVNKRYMIIVVLIITIFIALFYINTVKTFDIKMEIKNYQLTNSQVKDNYMNYLKKYIKVNKLMDFIINDYVALSPMSETATGEDVIKAMEFVGYKMLFKSMFDKTRINFDDCPVTEKFKEKFNTNLLEYFNLIASEDCESNCMLNREKQEITVEVYGNFENTEPTYQNTHHFHYTLDSEGNVDDVVFDYTEG